VPTEERPASGIAMRAFDLAWQREQYHGGWAGVSWPREAGGRGLSLARQMLWYEQYALADAPHAGVVSIALGHAGPTLIANGNVEQQARHLAPILRGEQAWAQGFSEPGAGSDLAGLRTHARLEGDDLVVNGQKIWTTHAHLCDYQELLVRTEPGAERHRGLSWLICDLRSDGIQIRPISTMDGGSNFCEVFYDDVVIPVTNVVGGLGNGWRVAMSTLGFERGTMSIAGVVGLTKLLDRVEDLVRQRRRAGERCGTADELIAHRLIAARTEVAALRALTIAFVSRTVRTGEPGSDASIVRLYLSEVSQRVKRLGFDALGFDALRRDDGAPAGGVVTEYLYSFAHTLGGGTAEIQRDIIAHRVLGLPR
jgi:alkylation response protein AidB-like acyl-CoA dehydrogenase